MWRDKLSQRKDCGEPCDAMNGPIQWPLAPPGEREGPRPNPSVSPGADSPVHR